MTRHRDPHGLYTFCLVTIIAVCGIVLAGLIAVVVTR